MLIPQTSSRKEKIFRILLCNLYQKLQILHTFSLTILILRCFLQFVSVIQWCLTLYNPMECSMPGFPVNHQHPELAQSYIHWIADAIQPTPPLSSPSPPAFNLSQCQGLFQGVSSSHQVANLMGASALVFPVNIQDWFPLGLTYLISMQSKRLSRVFSNTTVQKH